MTCADIHFLASTDPTKVAAAASLGRLFGRGLSQGGALTKAMGPKLMPGAGSLSKPMGASARATPLTRPMQRLMGNPNFQEVMSSSQSGFPKLPGMNPMSPSTMQGILRPGQLGQIGAGSGTMNQLQQNLTSARPAMARTIRGFRGLQRQGTL